MSAAPPKSARPVRRSERGLEVLTVVLLGIATLGSAWCGYQASRWNGQEAEQARRASDARIEASRRFSLGTQTLSYDTNVVGQYAQAVVAGNDDLRRFIRDSLMRPEFLPYLDRWEADLASNGESAQALLQDQAYVDAQFVSYHEVMAQADEADSRSREASSNSERFVLTTLLLASALFFAGITTSFRTRGVRVALLAGTSLILVVTAGRLVDLPTA